MNDTIPKNRHLYVVNNTKKEILGIPISFTVQENNNNGFIYNFMNACIGSIIEPIKVCIDKITESNWSLPDDIKTLKDEEINLNEYEEKGYVLK